MGDTLLKVYDADGILVAEDDNGGFESCSRVEVDLPAGEYTVQVSEMSDLGKDVYALEYYNKSSCTTCGNGIREVEECDGFDLGSCPIGPCSAACTCPFVPLCGDSIVQAEAG